MERAPSLGLQARVHVDQAEQKDPDDEPYERLKKITKKITSELAERASDIIMNRFGLTESGEKKTLEEIGKKYKIVSLMPNDSFILDFKDGFFKNGVIMIEIGDFFRCHEIEVEGNF